MTERQELDGVQFAVAVDVSGIEQNFVFLHHVQLLKSNRIKAVLVMEQFKIV